MLENKIKGFFFKLFSERFLSRLVRKYFKNWHENSKLADSRNDKIK
jgi:hypothetical protein